VTPIKGPIQQHIRYRLATEPAQDGVSCFALLELTSEQEGTLM